MNQLILRTRLELLERSLEEVRAVLERIDHHRDDVEALLGLPESLEDHADRLEIERLKLARAVNQPDMKLAHQLVNQVRTELSRLVRDMRQQRKGAQAAASSINARLESLPRSRPLPEVETVLNNALREGLVRRAEQKACEVEALRKGMPANGAKGVTVRTWSEYARIVIESEEVFGEYVDFVGGLALRDGGFDRGICAIADELIRKVRTDVGDFGWFAPTLPARQATLGKTLARIIRMGFPEWSLWALPLTAHDLGHIVVTSERADDDLRRLIARDPRLQICLADAFATYVMGPAYACAEILMRLDPRAADGQSATRAEVILATLGYMDEEAGTTELTSLRQDLRQAWTEARVRTPGGAVADAAEIDGWVRSVAGSVGSTAALPLEDYPVMRQWAVDLTKRRGDQIKPGTNAQLRYVLNAAWQARLQAGVRPSEIEKEARKLWDRLSVPRPASGGGGRSSRNPGGGR